ncbi:MAG: L,D-transpeptidase family protein [Alphaproteobacteria bacterium]
MTTPKTNLFASPHLRVKKLKTLTLALLLPLLLQACQTAPQIPTSQRLQTVKQNRLLQLEQDLKEQNLTLGAPTFIRIFKEEKTLELWIKKEKRYEPFKKYEICKFSGTLGPKLFEGDLQSPEGFYEITANQLNPWSKFHLSLNLGFPNQYDRAHGRTGSNLMIHGNCKSTGCYAVTDEFMEEIYLLVEASIAAGHPVHIHIFPFRMTDENMTKHKHSKWINFWQHLKHGYDQFENHE